MELAKRLKTRLDADPLRNDWSRQYVLSVTEAREILEVGRDRIPDDVRETLLAVEDSSRDPPTHILLKPSAYERLAASLVETREQRAESGEPEVDSGS